ncbi:conserved hypothetical protein [Halobacterium salinarum NRC-1]|uniref:Spurious ORF n=1 Tax=Halobacterium salinarum (strain ATCC 700922 / JCM 11081 / NRC-1) TaxID=64091 RepID=Q9HMN1_HALSA|nr:conserved hypothetical protein [Halobacterium salinarum NRC-1]DAC79299.1 TPA_inf: spurious ORF [Halobacterium salinarum NRC-1]
MSLTAAARGKYLPFPATPLSEHRSHEKAVNRASGLPRGGPHRWATKAFLLDVAERVLDPADLRPRRVVADEVAVVGRHEPGADQRRPVVHGADVGVHAQRLLDALQFRVRRLRMTEHAVSGRDGGRAHGVDARELAPRRRHVEGLLDGRDGVVREPAVDVRAVVVGDNDVPGGVDRAGKLADGDAGGLDAVALPLPDPVAHKQPAAVPRCQRPDSRGPADGGLYGGHTQLVGDRVDEVVVEVRANEHTALGGASEHADIRGPTERSA